MRKILFSIIFIAFFTGCSSVDILPTPQASQKSVKNTKIQLYIVYRDNCPACLVMKKIMERKDIAELLKGDFTITKVNIRDKDTLPKIWMRPTLSPTFYFLDSKKNKLVDSINAVTVDRFKSILLEAIAANNR